MYEAMARRYRPATFDQVVGQEHVAQTLRNAIAADRVAHAYLFCGPHGCGKTSMARIFAKALTCEKGPTPEPCGECDFCRDILRGQDVDVQEIDGASNNSVEQVRSLREQAGYVPNRARYKIYIIDEVHMLSVAAFNALLKTLEEPPPHVKFILATTDPHKMPDTVLSRCQRFDFRLVPPPTLATFLKSLVDQEGADVETAGVEAVAAFSNGSVRDALVLLDQLLSYASGTVTREDVERVRGVARAEAVAGLIDHICAHDIDAALATVDQVAQTGVNVGDYLDQLIAFCRDLMLVVATGKDDSVTAYGPAREILDRLREKITLDHVLLMLDIFAQARTRVRMRALSNPLVPLEMAVARLAGLDPLEPVGTVLQKLDALAKGAPLPPPRETPQPRPVRRTSREASRVVSKQAEPEAPPAEPDQPTAASAETSRATVPEDRAPEPPTNSSASVEPEPNAETQPDSPWPGAQDGATPAITTEQARSAWPAIMSAMNKARSPDLPYLRETASVHEMKGDTLVLSIPGRFQYERLDNPKRKERIAGFASQVLGGPVEVVLKLDTTAERNTEAEHAVETRSRQDATNDPAVRLILDRFDGQVVNIENDTE